MLKTRRNGMTRAEVLVVIAIVAMTIVLTIGLHDLYLKYVGRSAQDRGSIDPPRRSSVRFPGSSAGSSPTLKRPGGFWPCAPFDTSGYSPMVASIRPWSPDASLESIAEFWKQPGLKVIAELNRLLQEARNDGDAKKAVNALAYKAMMFHSEGDPKHAYEALVEARSLLEKNDSLAQESLYTIIYFQGVAAMRRGENENCIDCRGESSCILPISPAAVHTNPTGSRLAIGHFTEYLAQFPDDLEVRWLLNLAHMTLGEYPDKVDPRFRISLDRFRNSEFDIGKFRDVGHLVGVNRFNQAGGAIMEDFDNDGLLDMAVTSFDPTQPMAYYRNKGDGTFEDRTEEAGVTGQLGGLVCYQTDYNNDGRMDMFIPRGAWLPHPIRPSLLRNNGDGTFTDVTKEAGLLDPVNSISASWADYDNDGWLDLFVGCERQPNRLYHNRGDGTFEEVSATAGLCNRLLPNLQGVSLDRLRQRRLSRPVPQQSGRDRRAVSQQSRRHVHGRHLDDGHRRSAARLLVLGVGLRQRRLARHLRHLLRPHARGRGQGPDGPAARAVLQPALSQPERQGLREQDQGSRAGHGLRHHGEQLRRLRQRRLPRHVPGHRRAELRHA